MSGTTGQRMRFEVLADTGPARREVGLLQRQFDALGSGLSSSFSQGLSGVSGAIGSLQGQIAGLAAAFGAVSFARGTLQVGQDFDRINSGLRVATGSAELAAAELDYVREVSDRLGLPIREAASEYAKFAVAARGTSVEGRQTHAVFEGMASAARVMGMNSEQFSGAMNALQQVMSKGKVSAEELRGQLGERLWGAFQTAARGMGMTTEALNKALEEGKVYSEEFLPRFARQLQTEFGPEAARAAQSLQANLARAGNAWTDFQKTVFDSGFGEAVNRELQSAFGGGSVRSNVESLAQVIGQTLGSAVTAAGDAFRFVRAHADEFKAAMVGIAAIGAAGAIAGISTSVLGLAGALGPAGIAIGAIAGTLYYFRDAAVDLGEDTVQLQDVLVGAWEYVKTGVSEAVRTTMDFVKAKWQETRESFPSLISTASSVLAATVAVFRTGMELAYDVVKAKVEQIKNSIAGIVTAMGQIARGDFSGAGQTIRTSTSGAGVSEAFFNGAERMAAAARQAWQNGDVLNQLGMAFPTVRDAASTAQGAVLEGSRLIGQRAVLSRNDREGRERERATAQAERDRREAEERQRREAAHRAWLDQNRPDAARPADGGNRRAGGGSRANPGEGIDRQIEQLREQVAAQERLNAVQSQGEEVVRRTAAENSALAAVQRLNAAATQEQRDQVYQLTLRLEQLKEANRQAAEAERRRRESGERASRLLTSYEAEASELRALAEIYRSGTGDVIGRVAALEQEREIREKIRDLTDEDAARVRRSAAATAELRASADRAKQSYEATTAYLRESGDAFMDVFRSIRDGSATAGEAISNLAKRLGDLATQRLVFDNLAFSLGLSDKPGANPMQVVSRLFGGSSSGSAGQPSGGASASGGGIFSGLGSALSSAWSWAGGLLGSRAGGGPVSSGGLYEVNEFGRRREWFVAPMGGAAVTPGQFERAMSGGRSAAPAGNVVINVHGVQDAPSFQRSETQIYSRARRALATAQSY